MNVFEALEGPYLDYEDIARLFGIIGLGADECAISWPYQFDLGCTHLSYPWPEPMIFGILLHPE